jgi:murein L,D-transpeptidase YcbB/YkuD
VLVYLSYLTAVPEGDRVVEQRDIYEKDRAVLAS